MSNPSSSTLIFIATILQIVWGLSPSASKLVIDEIPVELFITIRLTISSLFLLSVLSFRQQRPQVLKVHNFSAAIIGVGGHALASIGTLYAIRLGGVANFSLLGVLSPILTSIAAMLILNEKPRPLFYLALVGCVLGALLLVVGKHQLSSWSVAGSSFLLILLAYSLQSVTFVFSKKMETRFTSMQYLAIAQLAAAAFMWLLELVAFQQSAQLRNLSFRGWWALVFVAVVSCAMAYFVHYWLLRNMQGHKLALFDGIYSLSATSFAVLFFADPLNLQMIIGGLLLLFVLWFGNSQKSDKVLSINDSDNV